MSGSPPRTLRGDLHRIGQRAGETARDAGNLVRAAVAAEPYVAAATALGVGFLAGGGLDRRTRAFLLGTGARMVGVWLAQGRGPRDAGEVEHG